MRAYAQNLSSLTFSLPLRGLGPQVTAMCGDWGQERENVPSLGPPLRGQSADLWICAADCWPRLGHCVATLFFYSLFIMDGPGLWSLMGPSMNRETEKKRPRSAHRPIHFLFLSHSYKHLCGRGFKRKCAQALGRWVLKGELARSAQLLARTRDLWSNSWLTLPSLFTSLISWPWPTKDTKIRPWQMKWREDEKEKPWSGCHPMQEKKDGQTNGFHFSFLSFHWSTFHKYKD